ncbi:hypothetical protein A2U01_0097898, partial [Trifolium medium]|nr:hypothetical protein [Trifolium medium]
INPGPYGGSGQSVITAVL